MAGEVEPAHRARPRRAAEAGTVDGVRSPSPWSSSSGRPAPSCRLVEGEGDAGCGAGWSPASPAARQEVEHEVGDHALAARCGRSGRCRPASRAAPPSGRYGVTSSGRVPQPISSTTRPSTAEERHPQPGHPLAATTPAATVRIHRSAWTGRSSSATRLRPRGRRASRCSAATRPTGGGSSGRGDGPARRACPGLRWTVPARAAVVEPRARARPPASASGRGSATSGTGPPRRQAVEVDQLADAVGLAVGQLHHQGAALGVAEHGHGPPGDAES